MQIVLLATGEISKLPPLTEQITAPMLPVLDRPVISYHLEAVARQGYHQLLVPLYHLGDTVEHYCGDGKRWHVELTYLLQRQALGTAGTLKRAERLLAETFLLLPADSLLDLDIDAALRFHQAHGGPATVVLSPAVTQAPTARHTLQIDPGGRVIGQAPVATPHAGSDGYAITGAYLFNRAVLDLIPPGVAHDCVTELLPALMAQGFPLYGYVTEGYWNALADFGAYQAAQETMLQRMEAGYTGVGLFPTSHLTGEVRPLSPGIWSGLNSVIHPLAKLTPPLFIGADCRIGADSELGPQAILGNHVLVDEGATIAQSTILENSYVGRLVAIQQRIVHQDRLIDQRSAVCVQIPDRWLLGYVHPTLAPRLVRRIGERLFALVLLLLLLPFLLVLAGAIWLTSPGGIFAWVERIGVKPAPERSAIMPQPQPLYLLRLRTTTFDLRPTLLGCWLERLALHRLPELWNVVRGDLALVGVKPLLNEEAAKLTEEWQQVRYRSPAGFTGLWYTQSYADENFDALCVADSYQAVIFTWRQALEQLWLTPAAWWRTVRRQQRQAEAMKSSEVRSQPVVQRPPIGW